MSTKVPKLFQFLGTELVSVIHFLTHNDSADIKIRQQDRLVNEVHQENILDQVLYTKP